METPASSACCPEFQNRFRHRQIGGPHRSGEAHEVGGLSNALRLVGRLEARDVLRRLALEVAAAQLRRVAGGEAAPSEAGGV